jgi:hypothetical protein
MGFLISGFTTWVWDPDVSIIRCGLISWEVYYVEQGDWYLRACRDPQKLYLRAARGMASTRERSKFVGRIVPNASCKGQSDLQIQTFSEPLNILIATIRTHVMVYSLFTH